MRIEIDSERCIGSGQCAMTVPEVFDQDDLAGKVVLLDDRPDAAFDDPVHEAASRCPVGAIRAY
ncbi:ferredoxin [Actinoplanes siamensis]|uniref:ferredoxin n=1 Tax=Actinoplanes siamensis TaxID=1223317 RepID=UPI001EF39855|nr:ferredoxin [Actinoplanes siamensis]